MQLLLLVFFGYTSAQDTSKWLSYCRTDRCGSVVQDMLYAHAWGMYHLKEYGGCCGGRDCTELIATLNLSTMLPRVTECTNHRPVSDKLYRNELEFLTPDWLKHIRSQQTVVKMDRHTIVAHVRRGDVSNRTLERYRPNSYYIEQIEKYRTPTSRVVLFTENSESLDDFHAFNYTVDLTYNLTYIWTSIIRADVFIMSASSFSYVPALFCRGIVVYTPFWHKPMPSWIIT